jgi:preprotein translocase subunit YajC
MSTAVFLFLAQSQSPAGPGGLGSFAIPMICMGVIFYFLIIRPQKTQQKQLADRIAALKTGDSVVTSSGIHGIISNVKEGTTLMLKIADNVKIEIDKSAIASVDKGTAEAEKNSSVVKV